MVCSNFISQLSSSYEQKNQDTFQNLNNIFIENNICGEETIFIFSDNVFSAVEKKFWRNSSTFVYFFNVKVSIGKVTFIAEKSFIKLFQKYFDFS